MWWTRLIRRSRLSFPPRSRICSDLFIRLTPGWRNLRVTSFTVTPNDSSRRMRYMRISRANLRGSFVVLVITLSSIPAALPRTTADQSVSMSEISRRVLPRIVSLTTENAGGHSGIAAAGFFIGYGVIATDYRVVKHAIRIRAANPGEDAVDATIVAVDERRTVAFL